jgi:hypothetical protein
LQVRVLSPLLAFRLLDLDLCFITASPEFPAAASFVMALCRPSWNGRM